MREMFKSASSFNQDILGLEYCLNASKMYSCLKMLLAFNQDIGKWNVSKVTNFWRMFADANFNQDL